MFFLLHPNGFTEAYLKFPLHTGPIKAPNHLVTQSLYRQSAAAVGGGSGACVVCNACVCVPARTSPTVRPIWLPASQLVRGE